jgi:hypothetical protein
MERWMTKTIVALVAVSLLAWSAVAAAAEKKAPAAYRYASVQVIPFDTKEGVAFPPDFSVRLTEELVKELLGSERFTEVLREGEPPSEETTPRVKLAGTVTEFKKGSQMKRYMIGFGAGKTKIKATVRFTDAASGDVVYEKDVDGKVIMGFAGGDSMGAAHGLAKEVAKVAKEKVP